MTSRDAPEAEPTIWRIPDALWDECRPLRPPEKPPGTPGRPGVPFRRVLGGILPALRTGGQWQAVPAEFGPGSTCHRRFQEGAAAGTWRRLWADRLGRYAAAHGIGRDWPSADSATVPPPWAARTPGRTRPTAASWAPSGMC